MSTNSNPLSQRSGKREHYPTPGQSLAVDDQTQTDIVVIGGGVIGLSVAYRLARTGTRVTVVDAGLSGQASAAAAGMLAPLAESNSLPALSELGIPSLRKYPEFIEAVSATAGRRLTLDGPGILRVATTDEDAEQLCANLERQQASGFPVHLLTRKEAQDLEPDLDDTIRLAIHSPAERHLSPILLVETLRIACERIGVCLIRTKHPAAITRNKASWRVSAGKGSVEGSCFIACGGVWTPAMIAPLGLSLPITPLKGQILSVRFADAPPVAHTIYAHSTYIVPRPTGEIIVGATEEPEARFDAGSTQEAIEALLSRAQGIMPSLAKAKLEEARAGLRPASPDRLPMIGRLPGLDNAYVASGHGRNGILLAPITADLVKELVINGKEPPASVDPSRFLR